MFCLHMLQSLQTQNQWIINYSIQYNVNKKIADTKKAHFEIIIKSLK